MIPWPVLVIAVSVGMPMLAVEQSDSHAGRIATDVQLAPLASKLGVPKNIRIPPDIPSYEILQAEAGEKSTAVFEVGKYHKAYLESWNEQLYQYGFLNWSCDVRARMSLLTSLKWDRYRARGAHEGKADCFDRIEQLRKKYGDTATRRAAQLAYVQIANPDLVFVRSWDTHELRHADTVTSLDIEFVDPEQENKPQAGRKVGQGNDLSLPKTPCGECSSGKAIHRIRWRWKRWPHRRR